MQVRLSDDVSDARHTTVPVERVLARVVSSLVPSAGRSRTSSDEAVIAAFLLMVAIAGGNAVAIRYISCESCELDPFWAAGTRFALAALIFGAYVLWKRIELPRGGALLGAVLYGALTFGGAFGFAYWGFVRVEAGLGSSCLLSPRSSASPTHFRKRAARSGRRRTS